MIDEKIMIKKLENRIDTFVKNHPDEKDCLSVQSVKEFIQMLEAEAKKQKRMWKCLESELLNSLNSMSESKEQFCDNQGDKCELFESCFMCAIAGMVDVVKILEDEQEYSYANFDEYVREVSPCLDAEYDDTFSRGIERAIKIIREAGRAKMKAMGVEWEIKID